jgi:hypothetical protein
MVVVHVGARRRRAGVSVATTHQPRRLERGRQRLAAGARPVPWVTQLRANQHEIREEATTTMSNIYTITTLELTLRLSLNIGRAAGMLAGLLSGVVECVDCAGSQLNGAQREEWRRRAYGPEGRKYTALL